MFQQVPEVLMCYHLNGFVQKYAVYKTEDLPNLSPDCKFSPTAVRDMAKNVLAFLKQKATQVMNCSKIIKYYEFCNYYASFSGGSHLLAIQRQGRGEWGHARQGQNYFTLVQINVVRGCVLVF